MLRFSPLADNAGYDPFEMTHLKPTVNLRDASLEKAGIVECGWPSADGHAYFVRYSKKDHTPSPVYVEVPWGKLQVTILSRRTNKALTYGRVLEAKAIEVDEDALERIFLEDPLSCEQLVKAGGCFEKLKMWHEKKGPRPSNAADKILALWGISRS